MSLTPAVAVGMGVMVVSFLKLPLSAVIIATSLTVSAGLAAGPLIIVGVVVAYLVTLALEGRLGTGGPGSGAGYGLTTSTSEPLRSTDALSSA